MTIQEKLRQTQLQRRPTHRRPSLTGPHYPYPPAKLGQLFQHLLIPDLIVAELALPELNPRRRFGGITATIVAVPEAAVDEDDSFVFGQHDVGFTGQGLDVQSVAESQRTQELSHDPFWNGVLPSDVGHVLLPIGRGPIVHVGGFDGRTPLHFDKPRSVCAKKIVQDDERERQLIELFGFTGLEEATRGGTDAYIKVNHRDFPFEIKSTTRGSISTARDVGLNHILKWRGKHWLFGIYSNPETLEYCLYAPPDLMDPWINQLEDYIRLDVHLAKLVPARIDFEILHTLAGKKPVYSLEDAQLLLKKQFKTVQQYRDRMDAKNGYSPQRMLELLQERCRYLLERGATLNNPHIPKSVLARFHKLAPGDRKQLKQFVSDFMERERAVRLNKPPK